MKRKQKIIVAMSGGVDSTVAAALLKKEGYQLVGVSLSFHNVKKSLSITSRSCIKDDFSMARRAAEILDIPHTVIEKTADFENKILRYAWNEYKFGRTPNPCAWCNHHLKFGFLIDYARKNGADKVATGHHARIEDEAGSYVLKRGEDPIKDQSYFLFRLTCEQLAKIMFPIGNITKAEVRKIAHDLGFPNADREESQDACFQVPGESFPETLKNHFNCESRQGNFVDSNGNILGNHDGIHKYTIGQRKGLGIALGKPGYISRINPETGDITVTTNETDLLSDSLVADDVNWQVAKFAKSSFTADVQIRYRSKPVKAKVIPMDKGKKVTVKFNKLQRAITPGQGAVFYDSETLIGGGWIQ